MLKARSLLVATIVVTNLGAGVVSVYAETPTEANSAACNADAPAAVKAGTATPTTKDHMRVEAAEGITDAAYQAAYRTCMRRSGF